MMKYYSYGSLEYYIEPLCATNKGFFVDIGAHDGISGNNTKYFEDKGWNGICIEPHPDVFELLKKNRTCELHNCAVWNTDTEVDFLAITGYSEMLSGILESYDPRHMDRINREIATKGGSSRIEKIQAKQFSTIVKNKKIDFLSIDAEGAEMAIINTIDFNEYDIKVICIENNFIEPKFIEFFVQKGYTYHSNHNYSADQIFYKK